MLLYIGTSCPDTMYHVHSISIGVNSMAQDPLVKNSMANDFYLKILYVGQPRCQKTQLTQDMYILKEIVSYFTQYVKKNLMKSDENFVKLLH